MMYKYVMLLSGVELVVVSTTTIIRICETLSNDGFQLIEAVVVQLTNPHVRTRLEVLP